MNVNRPHPSRPRNGPLLFLSCAVALLLCAPARLTNDGTRAVEAEIVKPELVLQTGHTMRVDGLAVSPDGRWVATASADNTVRLWEATTGRELRSLVGHTNWVWAVAISPDNRWLASGGLDGSVKLWDVVTGKEARTLSGHAAQVASLAFSPDGRWLASGGGDDKTIKIWEAATGNVAHTLTAHADSITALAFGPDGRRLASGSKDKSVKLWDVVTGKEVRTLTGHADRVNTVAFSPDGDSLASGGSDRAVRLWRVKTGEVLHALTGHRAKVLAVIFSADGRRLSSGSADNTFKRWDVAAARETESASDETAQALISMAFSPDGSWLAASTGNKEVDLREAETGRKINALGSRTAAVYATSFSPDGKWFAAGGRDRAAHLWDIATGHEVRRLADHTASVTTSAFSPNSHWLVTGSLDGTIKFWDVTRGAAARTINGHTDAVNAVAFNRAGNLLASASLDGSIKLWETSTGREARRLEAGHGGREVRAVAFSPEGNLLASAGSDGAVKLWDAATGGEVRTLDGHAEVVHAVAFSPDGRTLASGGNDQAVKLWEVATGRELRTLAGGTSRVLTVAFSTDGRTLAAGGTDNTIRLWEVAAGQQLRTLTEHNDGVNSVSFSPDGQWLASGSDDGSTRVWDAATGQQTATLLCMIESDDWLVITPNGLFDGSPVAWNHILWRFARDTFEVAPVEIFFNEYFEPRLLPRLLMRETFHPVRPLGSLNRVQPQVRITKVEALPDAPGNVAVTVKVAGGRGAGPQGSRPNVASGVYDLRLFRDGQLIGYEPEQGGEVMVVEGSGAKTLTFTNVKLPRQVDTRQVEFSAYAFNVDRVRSATDRALFDVPKGLAPRRGRAYVVSVGVNAYENPAWNLKYAVNDARRIQSVVSEKIKSTGAYEEVVQTSIISDYDPRTKTATVRQATKNNFKAILDLLSGRKADPESLKNIPNADAFRPAGPEDLVLISFSSHGYADKQGMFYLLPYDIGEGQEPGLTEGLLSRCISSEELARWMRDIDAGELLFIVDACHSAASVQGAGFKPGPMASRGLGQLAYDKGMRVLTSTQADDVAWETEFVGGGQGLLTYALTSEGIERGDADFQPRDKTITLAEWLDYGVERVPHLAEKVQQKAEAASVEMLRGLSGTTLKRSTYQQPALFDFSPRRRRKIVVAFTN